VLGELVVRGPERIALTGPNGAGKTTILRAVAGVAVPPGIGVRSGAVVGFLPQLLLLDEATNNLDVASVRQFTQALEGYRARCSLVVMTCHSCVRPYREMAAAGLGGLPECDRSAVMAFVLAGGSRVG
jgi:ATPase subunit of ABC transporter with duplicated ATPase domains